MVVKYMFELRYRIVEDLQQLSSKSSYEFDKEVKDFEGLHEYIYYYNNRRIKSKLKMAPVEYRNRLSVA